MAGFRISSCYALSILFCFTAVFAKDREDRFQVDIGFFRFPLNDPRIENRVLETERNLTAWGDIFDSTLDYLKYNHKVLDEPLPNDVEEEKLRQFARDTQVDMEDFGTVLGRAKASYDEALLSWNNDSRGLWRSNETDLSDKFLEEAYEEFKNLEHERLAAWAGVGSSVDCAEHINRILKDMDEWEKAGMAAATTLMALLPTFLAFGSLFVPRSSEAFATSWLIGLGAALFSLGLPVKSLSCVRRKQVLELSTMDKDPLDTISDLGDRDPTVAPEERKLDKLREWTQEVPPKTYMRDFSRIRKAVGQYKERWHWWHVPAIFIAAGQGVIFGFAIEPLLKAGGIPKFIFACAGVNWTGLYLSVSAAANALFRLALWQLCDHEVVNIYHLSEAAKASLSGLTDPNDPNAITTETQLPPLYPPLISKLHTSFGRFLAKLIPSFTPLPEEHPPNLSRQPIISHLLSSVPAFFKSFTSTLTSGFASTSAAPRYRPLIVLIHLSTTGRPQLRTLLTGFCEAALLLVLTFFFASQWGGNLFVTSIALALLLIFITLGRALSIVYVWLSARTWGLHTINCDEQAEILGCLRIVCSMQGVLVAVNGAHYFGGFRLDGVDGFEAWKREYDGGVYDVVGGGKGQVVGQGLGQEKGQERVKGGTVGVSVTETVKGGGDKSIAGMV